MKIFTLLALSILSLSFSVFCSENINGENNNENSEIVSEKMIFAYSSSFGRRIKREMIFDESERRRRINPEITDHLTPETDEERIHHSNLAADISFINELDNDWISSILGVNYDSESVDEDVTRLINEYRSYWTGADRRNRISEMIYDIDFDSPTKHTINSRS